MSAELKKLAPGERPRERFFYHGAAAVSDQDLLAILLRTGTKGQSVLDVSRCILRTLPEENIYYLGETDVRRLCTVKGIGRDKAVTLCAAIELGKRIARQRVKANARDFSSPSTVAEYVMEDMRCLGQEKFSALYVSSKNKLIALRELTSGTLNESLAKARDVFRYALEYNAAAVILIHNHPSGDPTPSKEDIKATQCIAEAGRVMGIPVLDHIIIGDGTYVSLCERGYI